MLLRQEKVVTLEKRIPKILCSGIAYGNTFVFSHVILPGEDEGIVHMDANGKFLFEHKYKHVINTFQMINQKEVIVLDVPGAHIDIINLEQKKVRSINHQYHFQDVIQMRIQTFEESKFFAVIEKGTYNVHNLFITYYNYNDTHDPDNCKPIYSYESAEGQWTYECPIKKGNANSMIVWFKPKQEGEIQLSYIDLRAQAKNHGLNILKFKNTGGEPYGINNFNLTLRNVWEVKEGRFMLIGETSSKGPNHQYKPNVVNNNYVYDVASDTLREANFYFLDEKNFCWNDQMIDIFNLGKVSVFYTYKHQNDAIQISPVYFVNNESEEIVGRDLWKAECYYTNYFIPGFDSRLMVESYHINGDVETVKFTVKKALDPKEISLYFMLHINEDFDEDLLGDAIELLHH